MTAQRRVIAEAFGGTDVHLTAADVYERARQALPELGLATVYNTLNELVAAGLLVENRHLPGPARYDPGPQPHHHLVCRRCHRLVDVDPTIVGPVTIDDVGGFRVDTVEITFGGMCGDCQAAESPGGSGERNRTPIH